MRGRRCVSPSVPTLRSSNTRTPLVRLKTAQGLHTDSALADIYEKQYLGLLYDASSAYNDTTEASVRGMCGHSSAVFRNTNVIKSSVHVTSAGFILAPRPLSLGCPSSPVGSLRVLQHLDVPCDLLLLDSPQPHQSCDDYKEDCCPHWDFSGSFFLMLLSLGPDSCVATAHFSSLSTSTMSSGFTCLLVCIRGSNRISAWSFSPTFGGVSLFDLRVSSPVRRVQLFLWLYQLTDHFTCKHLTPACARLSQTAPWIMPGVVDLAPTESDLQGPGFHQRGDVLILEGLCREIPALRVWTYVLSATNLSHLLFT